MSEKKQSKSALGNWKIEQVDEQTVQLVIPKGMKIVGDGPLTIEDIKDGIERYKFLKKGPKPLACCRRRIMMA